MNARQTIESVQIVSPPISNTTVRWLKPPRVASKELERLRRLAEKYPAPQSWYDETDCPIELRKK